MWRWIIRVYVAFIVFVILLFVCGAGLLEINRFLIRTGFGGLNRLMHEYTLIMTFLLGLVAGMAYLGSNFTGRGWFRSKSGLTYEALDMVDCESDFPGWDILLGRNTEGEWGTCPDKLAGLLSRLFDAGVLESKIPWPRERFPVRSPPDVLGNVGGCCWVLIGSDNSQAGFDSLNATEETAWALRGDEVESSVKMKAEKE
jgi:hypothetical protein